MAEKFMTHEEWDKRFEKAIKKSDQTVDSRSEGPGLLQRLLRGRTNGETDSAGGVDGNSASV